MKMSENVLGMVTARPMTPESGGNPVPTIDLPRDEDASPCWIFSRNMYDSDFSSILVFIGKLKTAIKIAPGNPRASMTIFNIQF